jgi:hypothetical protein
MGNKNEGYIVKNYDYNFILNLVDRAFNCEINIEINDGKGNYAGVASSIYYKFTDSGDVMKYMKPDKLKPIFIHLWSTYRMIETNKHTYKLEGCNCYCFKKNEPFMESTFKVEMKRRRNAEK